MDKKLIEVALRHGALYLVSHHKEAPVVDPEHPDTLNQHTIFCLDQLQKHSYTLDERALRMLNRLNHTDQSDVLEVFKDVYREDMNWTPLVRGWDVPTGETVVDHLLTAFYNIWAHNHDVDPDKATLLPCGHYIPEGTFDLSRYTGCPFCGQPIETNDFVITGQGTFYRELTGWDDTDMTKLLNDLLTSPLPLSSTEIDELRILVDRYELPDVAIPVRETAIVVAMGLINKDDVAAAARLIKSPADVLRMLWYDKTGYVQVIEPKTILRSTYFTNLHILDYNDEAAVNALVEKKNALKLKYPRKRCRQIAQILNGLDMPPYEACQIMHPKRGMWVRMIRALRLAEYAKKAGYERLRALLDTFYRTDYIVKQGLIDEANRRGDIETVLALLSQNPGLFARQLFSTLLRYDKTHPYYVIDAFRKVLDKVPLRLLISLQNAATLYFDPDEASHYVRTITGETHEREPNSNLSLYSDVRLRAFVKEVEDLYADALYERYSRTPMPDQKIYVDPELYNIPLPVGNRGKTVAGALAVPQGTKFDVLGDNVRIFLHWGKGLPAAWIDLDISAAIIYDDKKDICNFSNLAPLGAKHSGDMRAIPDQVGTAEYIELNLPVLRQAGVRYVAFVANSYSHGALGYNAMVGWMDSANPMTIDDETGVAYDPSCVQYFVGIDDGALTDGLVFGALDVDENKIIWLEMPFKGQTVESLDKEALLDYIKTLQSKLTIGQAFDLLIKARGMQRVDETEIDGTTIVYDRKWAYDLPAIVKVLVPDE